jgi:hypothetical protein
VRLLKTDNGLELGHIGFLGGAAPAVDGLKWQFNGDDANAVTFEYAASERIETLSLDTTHALVRLVKNLHGFFTEKFGKEAADATLPEYQTEWLNDDATIAAHEKNQEQNPTPEFTAPGQTQINEQETDMATQAELDALQKQLDDQKVLTTAAETKAAAADTKNAKMAFAQRVQDNQTFIDKTLNGGKAPRFTKTEGMAEFMAAMDDSQTFDFAAADGEKKVNTLEYLKSLLLAVPEQTALTKDFGQGGDDGELDANQLAVKTRDYQQAQAKAGVIISVAAAMQHITQEAG